ncbi:MAG: TolC family protein [Acidobacteria bacterium]|nr:TolC family protein [Acidobacteriota bacterium]
MQKIISTLILAALLPLLRATTVRAQMGTAGQAVEQTGQTKPTVQLSLKEAVDIALAPEGNARIQLAEELIHQAETRSAQARAALFPHVEASVLQQSMTRNLAAFGIRFQLPVPGFRLPELAGPFNVFDARATVNQNIFDLSAIRRFQASRLGVNVAEAESENAQNEIAGLTAGTYMAAIRADANVEEMRSNVALAEALLKLAIDQKAAGTGTGIDVTRARVQLANERQRLLVAENERRQTHLQLLRVTGLDLNVTLELTDKLAYMPVEPITAEQATAVGLQFRPDWKAQQRREENARLNYSATKVERIPSLVGFADYGSIGSSINNAIPTRTYGFSVRVPVFDGGRRDARRAETVSLLQQERIRTSDLRDQIELEVRLALDNLRSAEEQVKVAEEGLTLAQNELAQARRRFEAGVASSLEVTDAQTRVERARDNRIAALFNYNLARINLGRAMGTIRHMIK